MDRRRRKRMERYWARAEAKARAAIDRLDPDGWFDLWHTHVDWDGRGRAWAEDRCMVNAVAVRVLCHLEARLAHRGASVQMWADLSPETMDTGVYAHSANPNGSTFPATFPALDWQQQPPADVAAAVPATHRAGTASCDGMTWHVVQRRPAVPDAGAGP
ncbi:hypothetical protein [Xanthomonas cannabis]|uniref:hypothetical protein n=1 Tax=Xanthomonas cannabis TaxID=1885674 RepID=UPI001FBB1875|nr:hypothetical protein [Xanthomonas cannabis]NIK02249.1 hypothetical protein [Xanthomonas cannabis]NIK65294.1 hypothetical protein [Xanthomonas cannabis]